MALLLPPPAGCDFRGPAFDFARQGDRGPADFGKAPARLDPAVDVEAPRPGSLRPPRQAEVLEDVARDHGHLADLRPGDAGHRIQVDPQLVGMLQISGPDRMRIQVDATEVDDPGELRRIPDDDLLRRSPRWEGQLDRLDPLRPRCRRALLKEGLTLRAVDKTLEGHGPAGHAAQRALRHRQVIANQVELGVTGLRKEDFVGIADGDLTARNLDDLLLRCRHDSGDG